MITVDAASLLVDARGEAPLSELEAALSKRALTLGLAADAPMEARVAEWLAEGAPGARDPWLDPVDHLVAGFDARLRNGLEIRVRASPRRAVGPDLLALFFGARGRFGTITRAHLRVHRMGAHRPEAAPFEWPREPEVTPGEAALLEAIARELRGR